MDKQLLEEVKALGSLQYTPDQVRKILGLNELDDSVFGCDGEADLWKSYWAGFYETDIKLRKSVIDLATKGSSPAQAMLRKIIEDAETRRFYEQ